MAQGTDSGRSLARSRRARRRSRLPSVISPHRRILDDKPRAVEPPRTPGINIVTVPITRPGLFSDRFTVKIAQLALDASAAAGLKKWPTSRVGFV